MKKVAVLAFGNPLRCDDGIPSRILKNLKGNFDKYYMETNVDILTILRKYDEVVIIDTVEGKNAGEIQMMDISKLNSKFYSSHEFSWPGVLKIAEKMGIKLPKITFFGIVPKRIDIGTKISKELKERIPYYCAKIQKFLKSL